MPEAASKVWKTTAGKVPDSGKEPRKCERGDWTTALAALLLFIVSLLAYRQVRVPHDYNGGDNLWTVPTAVSLLREGNLDLSEFQPSVAQMPMSVVWIRQMNKDPRIWKKDGRHLNYYPLGAALTVMPAVWIWLHLHPSDLLSIREALYVARRTANIIAAFGVGLLFILLRVLGRTITESVFLSLLFAFATPHLGTHADTIWSHNLVLPWILVSLILVEARGGKLAALAALPLAMAYATRPDACLIIAIISLYVFFARPLRQTLFFAALGAAAATAFFAVSLATFGSLLPPYFHSGAGMTFANFPEPLLGSLISPSHGLLIYAPLLALAWLGAWLVWRRPAPHAGFFRALTITLALHLVMLSATPWWDGGYCFGPRLFSGMLPLYILLFIPALDAWKKLEASRRIAPAALFALLALWGVFVQWRCISDVRVHEWNATPRIAERHRGRLWEWRDMPLFRGWGTPPPAVSSGWNSTPRRLPAPGTSDTAAPGAAKF